MEQDENDKDRKIGGTQGEAHRQARKKLSTGDSTNPSTVPFRN